MKEKERQRLIRVYLSTICTSLVDNGRHDLSLIAYDVFKRMEDDDYKLALLKSFCNPLGNDVRNPEGLVKFLERGAGIGSSSGSK